MATRDMSTETSAPAMTLSERLAAARTWSRTRPRKTLLEEFEQLYLRNVDVLMGYFARRCGDPHTVADLTSETFVRAMDGFARFDPRRGSDRAWLFGIASHVFARHCGRPCRASGLARYRRSSSPESVARFRLQSHS